MKSEVTIFVLWGILDKKKSFPNSLPCLIIHFANLGLLADDICKIRKKNLTRILFRFQFGQTCLFAELKYTQVNVQIYTHLISLYVCVVLKLKTCHSVIDMVVLFHFRTGDKGKIRAWGSDRHCPTDAGNCRCGGHLCWRRRVCKVCIYLHAYTEILACM